MDSDRRLREAIEILKAYRAKRVFLFGSVAKSTSGDYSDIDWACEGLPPDQFFEVLGKLRVMPGRNIDSVDMKEVKATIRKRREREGILRYEAK